MVFGGSKPPLAVSEAHPGAFSYALHGPREITRRRIRTWAIVVAVVLLAFAAVAYSNAVAVASFLASAVVAAGVAVWAHVTRSVRAPEPPGEKR